jgi:hypothetical protein
MMANRREFMVQLSLGSGVLASGVAFAAAPLVDEADATAKALGYAADSAKVDEKKFTKHAAVQQCSNCTLFQGKAGDASGPCPIFVGKQVAAKGWCNSYVKKA